MAKPRFEVIKAHIIGKIEKGIWHPGDPVPSENRLAEQFEVSRMTARRALNELTHAGVLEPIKGAGTFVAEQLPTGSLLEIRNIAEEIAERGHRHRSQVLCLEARRADARTKQLLALEAGAAYGLCQLLHFENDLPVQWEERMVNLDLVPHFLEQDFTRVTPSAYLTAITPLSEADHWIEAVRAEAAICASLRIAPDQPCLKISRRTYSRRKKRGAPRVDIVSFAYLYHPGSRYRLGGHLDFHAPDLEQQVST